MQSLKTHNSRSRGREWLKLYSLLTLVALSISPAVLLGEGDRNILLIIVMAFSPIASIIFAAKNKISKESLLIIIFSLSILFFPAVGHNDTRWSTILYTLMFCSLFVWYDFALRAGYVNFAVFKKIIIKLLFAYTLMLVVQQISVLLGLPIPNLSNYDPAQPWKLNSLAAEPSHAARIAAILMIAHILTNRIEKRMGETYPLSRLEKACLWPCFLWTMTTLGSSTGLVMLVAVLLVYSQRKMLSSLPIVVVIFITGILLMPPELIERPWRVFLATITLDYEEVLRADHSGGLRIAPTLILIQQAEIFSYSGVFGNGTDSVALLLSNYIWGVEEDFAAGGLMRMWYEIGIVPFLLFCYFSFRQIEALVWPSRILIWTIVIFVSSINSQILWLTIILLYTIKFYSVKARYSSS